MLLGLGPPPPSGVFPISDTDYAGKQIGGKHILDFESGTSRVEGGLKDSLIRFKNEKGESLSLRKVSNISVLTYWRRRIDPLWVSYAARTVYSTTGREARLDVTLKNAMYHILTFLSWILWKKDSLARDGTAQGGLDSPWSPQIIELWSYEVIGCLEFSPSTVSNMALRIRNWLTSNAGDLLRAELRPSWSDEQRLMAILCAPGKLTTVITNLKLFLKRHNYKKAKPWIVSFNRWDRLNADDKAIANLWFNIAARADSMADIEPADVAPLPCMEEGAGRPPNISAPQSAFNRAKEWGCTPVRPYEAIGVIVNKDKIVEWESRFVPTCCNCTAKDDVRMPASSHERATGSGNTTFCLYHGDHGWDRIRDHGLLPIGKRRFERIRDLLGITNHVPRRTAAMSTMNSIVVDARAVPYISMTLFLHDMGWNTLKMLRLYAPVAEAATYAQFALYPCWGKLRAAKRCPSKFPCDNLKALLEAKKKSDVPEALGKLHKHIHRIGNILVKKEGPIQKRRRSIYQRCLDAGVEPSALRKSIFADKETEELAKKAGINTSFSDSASSSMSGVSDSESDSKDSQDDKTVSTEKAIENIFGIKDAPKPIIPMKKFFRGKGH